jgi:copper transport protein
MTGTTRRAVVSLVMLVAVLWLLLPAPPASAHAYLLASTPPDGYAVPTPPPVLSLDFDEAVTIAAAPVTLTDAAGTPDELGPATLSLGGRRLSTPVPSRLADGGYRIRWQVTADDGDLVSGTITFAVGTGTAAVSGSGGGSSLDSPIVIVARWMLFAGLALAVGAVVGERLVRRVLREVDTSGAPESATAPPSLVVVGAGLGVVAATALSVDQVGLELSRLITTGPGRLLGVEVIAFAAATILARITGAAAGRSPRWWVGVPLLAVVATEGLRAHPHSDSPVWGSALTVTHLLGVTIWVGALLHVLRAAHRWRGRIGWTRLWSTTTHGSR